ncbi:bifunctional diguanylate cyclase/phosphodiesterase [Jeotgalibacillus soli]|uniref:Histidine kinase n=1 Tax=Jeotgalibacillus soli TaxID=889306 RepID=A0A0C2V8S2_9BACL|nr:EAL domain-containing protein [Jeotgalibacillus soli]KIL45362.1 hypothetical protein KP78_29060 [Jeotgalibacillus soli]
MLHDRYTRLAEITKMIHMKLEKRSVLEQVVMAISEEIIRCDAVGVYLPIEDNCFRGFVGKPENFNGVTLDKMVVDPKRDLFAKEIIETRKGIYIPDTSVDDRLDPVPIQLFKIKSLFGMPITIDDSLYGLIFLFDFSSPLHLTKAEIESVESYALMAAVAIRNTDLLEATKNLVQDKQLLLDATKALSRCKSVQEVLETSFHHVGRALKNVNIAAYLIDIQTNGQILQKLSPNSKWKEEDWKKVHSEVKIDFNKDLIFSHVLKTKKPLLIPDVTLDPRPNKKAVESFGIKSMYVLPLISRGEVLGTLVIADLTRPKTYSKSEQQLSHSIADATAGVLDNLVHLEKLEEIIKHRTSELKEKNEILEQINEDLRLLSRKNESILNSAGEGIYGLNKDGIITFCNPIAAAMLNYAVEEIVGKHQDEVIAHLNSDHVLYEKMSSPIHRSLQSGEKVHSVSERFLRKDGHSFDVEYVSTPIQNNGFQNGVVVTFRDVTERKQMERKIHNQAYYDLITQLPNRSYLIQKLKRAKKISVQKNSRIGVLFLDLDRFKLINDALGHAIGDRVLSEVAERFRSLVSEQITVARLGGDEFIILVEDVNEPAELGEIANTFLRILDGPLYISGHELYTGASIGISVLPDDAKDEDELIQNADTAMYVAKEQGGTYHYFTKILMEKNIERSNLLNALYQAIERNELDLHYQPKVDYRTKKISGVEALLRWNHSKWGNIPPDKFIPIAEETGVILKIGEWALKRAAAQQREWQDKGYQLNMAVNFSTRQIQDPRLVATIEQILDETGMDPTYLEIELTEHTLIQSQHIEKLHELKRLGLRLSLDDFGTGYSSLSYIKDFPIDAIKIDRSFVDNMAHEPHTAALNSTIIHLAKKLDYDVIAEGVETKDQIDYLFKEGCYLMQGYYFSKALPACHVTKLLKLGISSNLETNE